MNIDMDRLVDVRPGLVWATTPDRATNFVNRRWREFCGSTSETAAADDWKSSFHPDDMELVQACWEATLASGDPGEVEARLRRHDGEYRRFSIRTSPVRDATGGLVCWCGISTEIEARGRAERAAMPSKQDGELLRANSGLLTAQALSHVGLFTVDLLTDEHVWSEEMRRIWEVEPGELITQPEILRRIHPDDQERCVAEYARVLEGAETDFAFRIVTPSGKLKYVRSTARVLTYVNGGPVVVGAYQDETERVLAEQALRAREAELIRANRELRDAQALSHVGSFSSNLLTGDHVWSEEMRRIWEFELGCRISQADVLSRIHPDDRAGFDAEYTRVLEGSDSDFAFRIVTPSGKVKHLRSVARISEYVKGGPVVVGTQQDETESVLAAEALKSSEAELRRANAELMQAHGHITAAQRLSQTGSFIWDVTADEHHWSDELYRIAEVDPDVTINMERVRECIHPEDRPALDAAIGQAVAGSGFDFSGRIVTPAGAIKYFHIVGQRIEQVADRLVFVGALRDITESKAAEEALNKARADLAHASRVMALSALTASIAHEVNQPLAGVVTNAATCSRMLGADPPNIEGARATAQRMIRDGNRAADVIQRLRALFSNKPPVLEAVDLNAAAAEVLALTSTELQAARVAVQTEFARGLPRVSGDRVQLQQVILNLVLNAAEAMSAVEGRMRELTVATARDGDDSVRLSVSDVGVGVTPNGVENLFAAFHTTKEKGMGVGLAVSRSIIESHQGRLWAEPNEGPGATFTFTIPVQPGTDLRPQA
jgi:PAS domain S-box-containing protein